MSLPPQIIQVKRLKRKARDDDDHADGIVDYLRVDGDRKRYRSDTYIYQRTSPTSPTVIRDEGEIVRNVPRNAVPVIHASKPGEEEEKNGHIEKGPSPQNRKQEAGKIDNVGSTGKDGAVDALTSPATSSQSLATPKSPSIAEPRRFHFSRPILAPSSLINAANATTGKRSRLNNATTVFVERGHKRTRTEDVQMKDADASLTMETSDSMHEPPPRKLKLPGSDRKGPTTKKPVMTVKKDVPVSMKKDWAGDVDEITRNMNDFALQLIGENLAEIEERDKKEAAAAARREAAAASKSPQIPRFKPKVPAQRYAERHPEVVATQSPVPVGPTAGRDEYESGSDDDYVVETYVRVRVSSLSGNVDPEKVGLLVFDNEPDLELFHGEEGDSDDEWPEDDEDENAENYYTADYPDDEVDSEDEYDRAAYHYRTGNASDLEEYDERDADDDMVLDGNAEDGEGAVPLSARLGLQPPSAFNSRKF